MSPQALADLLRTLEPALHEQPVAFCIVPPAHDLPAQPLIGVFHEREGTTVILEERHAAAAGLAPVFRAAWITLTVHSDLDAVGLTAAVAQALADAGISCNVIAAVHHDHLFVPVEQGRAALTVLQQLQRSS